MCSTSHPPGRSFTWYRNDKSFGNTIKNSLRIEYTKMSDTGRYQYQCQASDSGRSDPVQLTISNDWLILQAPYYAVFEGDPLRLRCYGWKGRKVSEIRYYRDGADVTPSRVNSELSIKQARTSDSGKYHCTGSITTTFVTTKEISPGVSISVQELFSTPVLRAAGSGDPIEGSPVTLSCVTQLNPQKSDTLLQRVFYKDSRALGRSRSSPDYHIPVAGLQDSGSYHCAVRTVTSSVWKRSPELKIAVKLPVSPPHLTVSAAGAWAAIGDVVEIRCESPRGSAPILYRFHHEGAALGNRTVSSRGPGSLALNVTSERDSGTYSCEADNGMASGPRRSALFHLSVLVPVSGATIAADRMGPEVMAGESLNLSCSVESGTAPLFKWLHNAQELAAASGLGLPTTVGNTLHFGSVQLGHGGNYQCIASNQLSPQRVFQAPSEILTITVIEHASPRVVVPVTVSFLFLLLMGVTAALVFYFKCWKKAVCPLEPESGDVEYTVVNIKKRSADKPKGTLPRDNEEYYVSYSVLPDPNPTWESAAGARAPERKSLPDSDIYENVPHL
ncbi:ataxin-2-like protein [Platysternon megacephalum]|uniref:Ataxin-2-like protein n=1 Tax=Platysternon megacephalum TaxID=55544 RepID=A0A4D9DTQ5_9SAUR|nr:ataxin-2-like protein [Platysternon megacephalum]